MEPRVLAVVASLIGGSGVAAGLGVLYSDNQTDSEVKTALGKEELSSQQEIVSPVVSYIDSSNSYKCKIFEVNRPVTQVFSEIKDQQKFLGEISQTQFVQDVKDACKGINSKSFVVPAGENSTRYVFVYKEGQNWIYSTDIHNKDWIKETGFVDK
ncbi:hypothetical protein MHF_1086 [Mycoplasma haemofelis Ohio2]|uniref:Uncharacterized protein n=1 Tax=Mycoplasma haemofelis (strain Ohio2) TaxID=859194 RepID=F6FJH9_MYCHI|nr:hypothetical protein MHF_1086 [Mycoplasma haemofelis Ohio2]